MNDLYNVQDVILIFEIVENKFEQMYQKNYHSASNLSGKRLFINY